MSSLESRESLDLYSWEAVDGLWEIHETRGLLLGAHRREESVKSLALGR